MARLALYFIAAAIVIGTLQFFAVRAGSLNPSASPAASMESADDIYQVVAGTNDASAVSANINGNILQQLKAVKNGFGL